MTATFTDVTTFINNTATREDLGALNKVISARHKTLMAADAALIRVGQTVTTHNLTPAYLNGFTGTVKSIEKNRATVTLDEESTKSLRYAGRRFYVPEETTNYELVGVPLTCLNIQD